MRIFLAATIFLAWLTGNAAEAGAQQIDTTALARAIITHADSLLRGKSNHGIFRMTVVRPEWTRSLTMESWERGQDLSFIEVLEPPKEAGTAFLKREGQMWSWLPDIERTIKIPPSMMMDSWMGSDFTNDDLLHGSSIIKDYDHFLLGVDTLEAGPSYVVQLVPKPEAPVVWDKIVIWVRTSDFIPLKEEYYDEKGRLVRTMIFQEIKHLGGRDIPTRFILKPRLKKGQHTELEILDIRFNVKIPDRVFTRQHLERSR